MLDRATLKFLSHELAQPESFFSAIHPEDEMFLFELSDSGGDRSLATWRYFRMGAHIARAIGQFVEWGRGGFVNVNSCLEFASGYGRVSRWLLQQMPAGRLWVSDIDPTAVAFQKQQFGVRGFVSAPEPEQLVIRETFDCIAAISLFSHLPPDLFGGWLRRLSARLAPGGMLAFSVHDHSLLPVGQTLGPDGCLFLEQSESRNLPSQKYGTMYVSEEFVRRTVTENGLTGYHLVRVPRALGAFQDVYLLLPAGADPLPPLRYRYGPIGAVEGITIEQGRVNIRGRAADLTEGSAISVSAWLNDNCVARCRPGTPRPDVAAWTGFESALLSGFDLAFDVPSGCSHQDLLVVRADADSGSSYVLHVGTLDQAARLFSPGCQATSGTQHPGCQSRSSSIPTRLLAWAASLLGRR